MLLDLRVRNLSVMAEAAVELGPGLNVLTGETGAGKSLLVDSLSLLAGSRADSEMIRTGSELLAVAGTFAPRHPGWREVLREAGLEADDADSEVMIRREISREGRNRIFVNDQPATLRLLSRLAPLLLRVHGQREELDLMASELQRHWLDRSGGAEAEELGSAVAECYRQWQELRDRLEEVRSGELRRDERREALAFQAQEIDAVGPRADELEELGAQVRVLRDATSIREALEGAWELLVDREEAVSPLLARSGDLLADLAEAIPDSEGWCRELDELRIRAAELGGELLRRLDGIESDPQQLEATEERLARLERLGRKYGPTTEEILAHRARIGVELEELAELGGRREELERAEKEALARYRDAALALSAARATWGAALGERIVRELADLRLGSSRFAVRLERRGRGDSPLRLEGRGVDFWEHGADVVHFVFSPNPGEELQPLAKAASGGELSRLYLALQLAAGGEDGDPSLVFDEIDAGIGGAEAAALGLKLSRLAGSRQVLVVTHLPQVASHADRHFKISKGLSGERTEVTVHRLAEEGRTEEVARMLAGHRVTDLSLSHARELLEAARREAE